eukprot:TRINITY_DN23991_c0_g1_i1.p2 TRINITY_DN23991_c0_g1~~TRINITY_DN23991_c0_g1_i1.p2  ORF type:complete len:327 (+),score=143.82 TRINITY_DN23991_c0_g1_i1:73-981(+)
MALQREAALPLPRLLLGALALLALAGSSCAKKKKPFAFAGIRPQIACEACEEATKAIYATVKDLRREKPGQKMREERILEVMEHSCHPKRLEGRWMRYLDIEHRDGRLRLVKKPTTGKLRKKHTSIQDACMAYVGGDADLSAMLYKDRKRAAMVKKVCVDGGDSGDIGPCHKRFRRPPLSAKLVREVEAEPFVEADAKELDAEKMMADMSGMPGMPEEALQMYSRDDIDDMAIDELVKGGMDEDEAAEMFQKMKKEGLFDTDKKGDPAQGDQGDEVPAEDEDQGAAAGAPEGDAAADGGILG